MEPKNGNLETHKHTIQKRQDPLAGWELPIYYGACGLGAKIGVPISKKVNTVLFGPLGKILTPVVVPKALKIVLKGFCPPAALAAWAIGSALNPVPGA